MSRRKAFTLVELLVVIAIIAVLLAVLMPGLSVAKGLAKRLQCQSREKGIASSMVPYADTYDGRMPTPDGGDVGSGHANTFVKAQWMLSSLESTGQKWYNMGCLFKANFVQDGRLFYCLATEDWQKEYLDYSNPGPWGTKLDQQAPNNPGNGNNWLRCWKGYAYWPLARFNYKASDITTLADNIGIRYKEGYPGSPLKVSDLAPTKSMLFDCSIHQVKGSGYNINVAYGDSHVQLVRVPKTADGKLWRFPYQQGPSMVPSEDKLPNGLPDPTKWNVTFEAMPSSSSLDAAGEFMWRYTASLSQSN